MLAALMLLGLLASWEAYARLGGVDTLILPAPSEVGEAMWLDRTLLFEDLLVTGQEILLGLAVALVAGLAIGVGMHMSRTLQRVLQPLIIGSQAIPVPVLAPLVVVWWGFGIVPKLAIVALVCFFPVAITTTSALRTVDPDLHKLLRTLGASRWQQFAYAELPAALPAALSGAKIAVAIGGIAAVFAEYAGSEEGLGHLVLQSIPQLQTARAWAAVTLLALFSIACFHALALAERKLTPWAHRRKDPE